MVRSGPSRDDGYVLALDVGTSALHCLLADGLGRPVAEASSPMTYTASEDLTPLAKEFDPGQVMEALRALTKGVVARAGIAGEGIRAVGVTSQRQGVVFLNEDGLELYCGPNTDARAAFEGAAIDGQMGKEVYATTGHFPSMILAPARLRWFRHHCPAIFERTRTVLTVAGWVAYRLTGRLMSEASLDGEAGLLDISSRERSSSLAEALELESSILPPLSPGLPTSDLSPLIGSLWGLPAGIPVVVAGPDSQCGLVGMGLRRPGRAGAVLGWSGALQVLTSEPTFDGDMRTWVGCHPLDGMWVAESSLGDAGNAYRWLKDTLLGPEASFEETEELARQAPSADGVMAFMGPGPGSAPNAGLRVGGLLFPSPVAFQEAGRGQIFKAALESIAYSLSSNLSTLRQVTGQNLEAPNLGGGMACSRTLATVLANVLGSPVRRSTQRNVSARGASMIAAVQTGADLDEMMEEASSDFEEVQPGAPTETAQYQEHHRQWLRLYQRLEWD